MGEFKEQEILKMDQQANEKIPNDGWKFGHQQERPEIDVPRLRNELARMKEVVRELERHKAENLLLTREKDLLNNEINNLKQRIIQQNQELVDLYRKLNGNQAKA
jgi:hypothetical protein